MVINWELKHKEKIAKPEKSKGQKRWFIQKSVHRRKSLRRKEKKKQ